MKILLLSGTFEVMTTTGIPYENETDIENFAIIEMLGVFQGFQNSLCFFSMNG